MFKRFPICSQFVLFVYLVSSTGLRYDTDSTTLDSTIKILLSDITI